MSDIRPDPADAIKLSQPRDDRRHDDGTRHRASITTCDICPVRIQHRSRHQHDAGQHGYAGDRQPRATGGATVGAHHIASPRSGLSVTAFTVGRLFILRSQQIVDEKLVACRKPRVDLFLPQVVVEGGGLVAQGRRQFGEQVLACRAVACGCDGCIELV